MNGNDVQVDHRCLSLTSKPLSRQRTVREVRSQRLDGHEPLVFAIESLEDDALCECSYGRGAGVFGEASN